ncbi:SIS domain-containing protein [Alloacidobacterium dinghuense]|uniref:SIS domain-containing protein n=1 Tax=Alloacidobacterium dinghuense TaxID=2763107 RepID=A0A7G8BJG9_9BACT|nr:SIS domain-containing protein [Alloacidobacterium dinghuense]QNI32689.1 SIS domain-containing protein [Alloacidobacterium dinghuense]
MSVHTMLFLQATQETAVRLEPSCLDRMAELLAGVRDNGGRVFFLGTGGGAANASHAVNDFRKIAEIECYAPSDNVSELTARTNDDGWETCYANWLRVSKLNARDAVVVFSVGGGSIAHGISLNIVRSVELATQVGAKVLGVVGRDGGYTAQVADACVIIPTIVEDMVTPLVEAFQAVVWHLIVSHPRLKVNSTKWESTLVSA